MDKVGEVLQATRMPSTDNSWQDNNQIGKCRGKGMAMIQDMSSIRRSPMSTWLFVMALFLMNMLPGVKAQQREQFLSGPNTWSVGLESLSLAYQNCVSNENGYNKSLYTVSADCTFGPDPGNANLPGYRFALYFNEYGPGATKTWWYDFFPYTYSCSDPSRPAGAPCVNYKPPKNLGCGCTIGANGAMLGDPINAVTGNAYADQEDFVQGDLSLHRYYNSDPYAWGSRLGVGWLHTFDRRLLFASSGGNASSDPSSPIQVTVQRQDGRQLVFNKINGVWQSDADVSDALSEVDDDDGYVLSWTLFVADTRQYESYSSTGALLSISDSAHVLLTLDYTDGTQQSMAGSVLPKGLLWKITDSHGRALTFSYSDNPPNVAAVVEPDGGTLKYAYDSMGRLSTVTYPDGTQRQYHYDESAYSAAGGYANKLTSIIDESNTRYTIFGYQSDGRANSTQEGSGADLHKISYTGDGSTSIVTYPLGQQATATFTAPQGTAIISNMSARCGTQCDQQYQSQTLDANGYPAVATDFNGNATKTTYDANGLLDQRIEASGTTSQRTTNFTWNTPLRLPLTRTTLDANGTPVSTTQWLYTTTGQTLARCDIDPTNPAASNYTCTNTGPTPAGVRRWTYTYCTTVDTTQCPLVGLTLTATGPRTDTTQTTTYTYYLTSSAVNCGTPGAACYQAGDLHTITDAAGHVTTIASYDANGRATRITDANGINTDLTYTPRGWLASRTVAGQTTTFTYTPYGAVQTVTDADNVTTTYGYDAAHRLVKITDALGNYVQYTLDAAGNKTAEQVYDASGTLHQSLTRSFNTLGQLTKVMDGLNHTIFDASASHSYDANGNLVQSADGLGIQRQQSYDALNRLVQTLDNYHGTDSATQNTRMQYAYDSLDRLTQLTDPSNLATSYSYDGLGNATGQQSPDSGTTSRTFDAAGNVLTRTDAKGITATTTYDVLDRPLTVSYPDSTQSITYAYDEANSVTGCSTGYPIGRLTRIIEQAVTTVYCYDARGNVIQKQQITAAGTDTIGYSYTNANRLSGIVYPSGTHVSYTRDGDGRIQSITATPNNGTASTVVSHVTYQPFGPVSGYTLGNGQPITRTYDANYRLTDLTSPAFTLHVARDAMGNITAIGNSPGANPATETYSYDPLYRLTQITEADGSTLESVTYNPTGDRLSKTGSGLATGNYSYNPNTHQLIATGNAARSVDANGNTTAITEAGSVFGFGYNDRNRMSVAQLAGSTVGSYTYNALNKRVQKVANGATQRFSYNEASQMLAEYGATNRDYIWMDGIPVANVDISGTTSSIAYVTADQLGTPRAVADGSSNTLWQWAYQGNAWGEQQPNSNGYAYNFRFPGQYFDAETGLHQNVNRDYDSSVGRYAQSDPLGLLAGPSTYSYAHSNPGSRVDPDGQLDTSGPLGQALKRGAITDAAGGGPEDLIGDVIALGVAGFTLADEIAKGANQREVHYICDAPPPTNLNDCDLAKWKLTKALQCKLVRQRMADKWFGGTFDAGHAKRMSELDNEIATLRRAVDRICKPCP